MSQVRFIRQTRVEADDANRPEDESSFVVVAGTLGVQVDGDAQFVWIRVGRGEGLVVRARQGSVEVVA